MGLDLFVTPQPVLQLPPSDQYVTPEPGDTAYVKAQAAIGRSASVLRGIIEQALDDLAGDRITVARKAQLGREAAARELEAAQRGSIRAAVNNARGYAEAAQHEQSDALRRAESTLSQLEVSRAAMGAELLLRDGTDAMRKDFIAGVKAGVREHVLTGLAIPAWAPMAGIGELARQALIRSQPGGAEALAKWRRVQIGAAIVERQLAEYVTLLTALVRDGEVPRLDARALLSRGNDRDLAALIEEGRELGCIAPASTSTAPPTNDGARRASRPTSADLVARANRKFADDTAKGGA